MEDAEFILAQGVYGYLLDSRLNPLFLSLISNTDWYRGIMRKIFVGSTQIHIRSTEFLEVVIPIPPVEEQNDIAERINMMESQILLKQKIKHKFSSLKKSLMQDLLTGKVRVTVN
jgi:type I restriction enzyme S subunit